MSAIAWFRQLAWWAALFRGLLFQFRGQDHGLRMKIVDNINRVQRISKRYGIVAINEHFPVCALS